MEVHGHGLNQQHFSPAALAGLHLGASHSAAIAAGAARLAARDLAADDAAASSRIHFLDCKPSGSGGGGAGALDASAAALGLTSAFSSAPPPSSSIDGFLSYSTGGTVSYFIPNDLNTHLSVGLSNELIDGRATMAGGGGALEPYGSRDERILRSFAFSPSTSAGYGMPFQLPLPMLPSSSSAATTAADDCQFTSLATADNLHHQQQRIAADSLTFQLKSTSDTANCHFAPILANSLLGLQNSLQIADDISNVAEVGANRKENYDAQKSTEFSNIYAQNDALFDENCSMETKELNYAQSDNANSAIIVHSNHFASSENRLDGLFREETQQTSNSNALTQKKSSKNSKNSKKRKATTNSNCKNNGSSTICASDRGADDAISKITAETSAAGDGVFAVGAASFDCVDENVENKRVKNSCATAGFSPQQQKCGNNNSSSGGFKSKEHSNTSAEEEEENGSNRCCACESTINDRFLLCVNDRIYHASCVRCVACEADLQESPTCFCKNDFLYCRGCYTRKFQNKCTSCNRQIQSTDWVRRARNSLYHLACFACEHCKRQLSTGEQFSLQDQRLLCKQHYMELVQGEDSHVKQKAKRVRTTFAEEQLGILQAHFHVDCNPDGSDLERIANLTGLSKRVTQVWFQNSRARQKKYQGGASKSSSSTAGANAGHGGGGAGDGHHQSQGGHGHRDGSVTNSGRSSVYTSVDMDSMMGESRTTSRNCDADELIFPRSVTTSADDILNTNDNSLVLDASAN